eukprot:GILJ01013776.1.p1 GENE.GILJ01013776.1~~GILJ01013776.1.p1  ORF type:complete len:1367 (+),score=96.96 GILJ01013776.1:92-4102(+)
MKSSRRSRTLRGVWKSLLLHAASRLSKRKKSYAALRYYAQRLLRNGLTAFACMVYGLQQDVINAYLGRTAVVKGKFLRTFFAWKHTAQQRRLRRDKVFEYVESRLGLTMYRCLSAWQSIIRRDKRNEMLVLDYRVMTLRSRAVDGWKAWIASHKHNNQLRALCVPLVQRRLERLVLFLFSYWVQWCSQRRAQASQLNLIRNAQLEALHFRLWKRFSTIQNRRRERALQAVEIRRLRMEDWALRSWQFVHKKKKFDTQVVTLSLHMRARRMQSTVLQILSHFCVHSAMERKADRLHFQSLFSKSFASLIVHCNTARKHRFLARRHGALTLETIFRAWLLKTRHAQEFALRFSRIRSIALANSIVQVWSAWRQYTAVRRNTFHVIKTASDHFHLRAATGSIKRWRSYTRARRFMRQIVTGSTTRNRQTLLSYVFCGWSRFQQLSIRRNGLIRAAVGRWTLTTASRCMYALRIATQISSSRRRKVESIRRYFRRGVADRCFQSWCRFVLHRRWLFNAESIIRSRSRLYDSLRAWNAWISRFNVRIRRTKKVQYARVRSLLRGVHLSFTAWRQLCLRNHALYAVHQTVANRLQQRRRGQLWSIWRARMMEADQDRWSIQFSRESLVRRCFSAFLRVTRRGQSVRRLYNRMEEIKGRCFEAWLRFVRQRVRNGRLTQNAINHWCIIIKDRTFSGWLLVINEHRRVTQIVLRVTRHRLVRMLRGWRTVSSHSLSIRDILTRQRNTELRFIWRKWRGVFMATRGGRYKLLRSVLSIWKKRSVHSYRKRRQLLTLRVAMDSFKLLRLLTCWKLHVRGAREYREEMQRRRLNAVVLQRHSHKMNKRLTSIAFDLWTESAQQTKRLRKSVAIFIRNRTLNIYFNVWKRFFLVKKARGVDRRRIDLVNQFMLQRRVFHSWRRTHRAEMFSDRIESTHRLTSLRSICRQWRNVARRSCSLRTVGEFVRKRTVVRSREAWFYKWQWKWTAQRLYRRRLVAAETFHANFTAAKVWSTWIRQTLRKRYKRHRFITVQRALNTRKRAVVLLNWKKTVSLQVRTRRAVDFRAYNRMRAAIGRWRHRTTSQRLQRSVWRFKASREAVALGRWRRYARNRVQGKDAVAQAAQWNAESLLLHCLHAWRRRSKYVSQRRRIHFESISKSHQRTIHRTVMQVWRDLAQTAQQARKQRQARVAGLTLAKELEQERVLFRLWRRCASCRAKLRRHIQMREQKTERSVMAVWDAYVIYRRKWQSRMRSATVYSSRRHLGSVFFQWRTWATSNNWEKRVQDTVLYSPRKTNLIRHRTTNIVDLTERLRASLRSTQVPSMADLVEIRVNAFARRRRRPASARR